MRATNNPAADGFAWDGTPKNRRPPRALRVSPDSPTRLLRSGQTGHCTACGNRVEWYYRDNNRAVPLHPGELPTHLVPDDQRWHVLSGVARPTQDGSPWCRVHHHSLCPATPEGGRLSGLGPVRYTARQQQHRCELLSRALVRGNRRGVRRGGRRVGGDPADPVDGTGPGKVLGPLAGRAVAQSSSGARGVRTAVIAGEPAPSTQVTTAGQLLGPLVGAGPENGRGERRPEQDGPALSSSDASLARTARHRLTPPAGPPLASPRRPPRRRNAMTPCFGQDRRPIRIPAVSSPGRPGCGSPIQPRTWLRSRCRPGADHDRHRPRAPERVRTSPDNSE